MRVGRSARTFAAAVTLALSFTGGYQAMAAPAADSGAVRVVGQVVTVADGPTTQTRVRTADGAFVPVAEGSLDQVAPGSTVAVTVDRKTIQRPASSTRFAPAADAATGSTPTVVAAPTPIAAGALAPSVQQVSIAIVTPAGATGTPATDAQVRAQVASVSNYWSEQTGGAVRFAVSSVSAPMTLSAGCSDAFGMWREAASRTGFTPGTDKHLVLVVPQKAAGCSYGLASIGSDAHAGGYAYVADTAWPVLAHELGHNLGLNHAEKLACTGGADASLSALSSKGCTIKDYGDPWDVMAASPTNNAGSLSAPQAVRLGLMPASAVTTVTSGTQAVTLGAVSGFAGTRTVKVVDPSTGVAYYVEYRTRTGRDYLLYENMVGGVRVLREDTTKTGSAKPTLALDATPTGASSDLSWGIPVGGSFSSYGGGVTVRVTGQDATTAQVTVTAGTAATGSPTPTTPTQAPTQTPTKTPTPAPTPTPVSTTAKTADLSPSTIWQAGPWYFVPSASYAFGTALVTYTYGANFSLMVDGGTFDLIGTAFPGGASGRILVDGAPVTTFSSYRADVTNPYQQVLGSAAVPAGRHLVTVQALPGAGQALAVDAYRVR